MEILCYCKWLAEMNPLHQGNPPGFQQKQACAEQNACSYS